MPWRGYARGPRPALTIALLALGATLLVRHLQQVDWPAMREVIAHMPRESLLGAGVLAALSYAVYCSFDLLARRTTGHTISRRRVLAIGFVGHACALNLGPAGAGVRFRLYARHGLPMHLIAALWLFNVATNWLGFVTLAGAALATRTLALPVSWGLAPGLLQPAGIALLAAVAAYLLACRLAHHRAVRLSGVEFRLPPWHVALLQCALSVLNWLLLAAIVFVLLGERADFEDVLAALMASALALAVVDVPAGLGVTETVFLALLGGHVPPPQILAALMAYRAIYFVGPLLLAAAVYAVLEWDAGRLSAPADRRSPDAHSPPH
ncbi:lysylphosphatidylglycerol synthase transmembrane domain-containing protein [Piscinibacter sp.]|uniref:lysylphosphatidylglycerol synthase transmembrane domain-containing protein n=1 Tax=Piscinibacter sp. TaxID=1903157 RepID=UPI002ED37CC1